MPREETEWRRYVQCVNEAEAHQRLERIVVTEIEPIIAAVIRKKLNFSAGGDSLASADAEDIRGDTITKLWQRFQVARSDPDANNIENVPAFAATTAYRACDEYLRAKYPKRTSLQRRLRYILTHQPGLSLWTRGDGARVAGFALWDGGKASRSHAFQRLIENPKQIVELQVSCSLPEMVARVFDYVGHPVELDVLVSVMANLLDVRDTPAQSADDVTERVADLRVDLETEVQQKMFLGELWTEVLQLQPRQRAALLLNLRDSLGRGVIALLPLSGVASIRKIAEALDMEIERFAAIWNDLPMDDAGIAEQMGITRQQVINLRKSARERLARRMRKENSW